MKTEIEKFEYYNIPEDDFEFSTSWDKHKEFGINREEKNMIGRF
jgi:hypothetical protein